MYQIDLQIATMILIGLGVAGMVLTTIVDKLSTWFKGIYSVIIITLIISISDLMLSNQRLLGYQNYYLEGNDIYRNSNGDTLVHYKGQFIKALPELTKEGHSNAIQIPLCIKSNWILTETRECTAEPYRFILQGDTHAEE